MQIVEGSSEQHDARLAVAEAARNWPGDITPDILFVFHSSLQSAAEVAAALHEQFPNTLSVGCTTAGEWLSGSHRNGALVLTGIKSDQIDWAATSLDNLDDNAADSAKTVCNELLRQLNRSWSELDGEQYFCLSLFDGLSCREEPFIAAMAAELGDIPLLGGSAGDDLKFEGAYVIINGNAYQHAAVFIMARSALPFQAIKHQHYIPGSDDVVITRADVKQRLVYRLDGVPAAERYAGLLGLDVADLNGQIFSEHPLSYPYANECYVRAIRRAGEDGSLEFGCAIEEGMVLNLCNHQNMIDHFNDLVTSRKQETGKAKLLIACNCIYRALEGADESTNQQQAEMSLSLAEHMIGFDTYGEQWQGLHMNQTLVALAIGSA